MLSASISIAMNNTAFALMVAGRFLLIHAFLRSKTSEIVDGLEALEDELLEPGDAPAPSQQTSVPDMAVRNRRLRNKHAAKPEITAFINLIVVHGAIPFCPPPCSRDWPSLTDAPAQSPVAQLRWMTSWKSPSGPDAIEVGDRIKVVLIERVLPNRRARRRA